MSHLFGRRLLVAACVVAALFSGSVRAADDKDLDKKVTAILVSVIDKGVDLYNGGDHNGCFRLYEGALLSLKPFLDGKPEWQKTVDTALTDAAKQPSVPDRAFTLRRAMDKIYFEINPKKEPATVWERLGGDKGVAQIVDDFCGFASADPKVNITRDGKYKLTPEGMADMKKKMVAMISQATGGPLKYEGKSMKEVHKGMGITDAEFNAAVADLKAAFDKNKVKKEDADVVLKAVEATRKDIVEPKAETPKTMWDRMGGEKNVGKIVDDFVAAASKDPKVNLDRGGKYKLDEATTAKVKKMLVEQISVASGGPLKYEGKSMKEVHKGMGVTEAEFDAAAAHFKKALESNGVKKEDVDALMKTVGETRKDIVETKQPDPAKDGEVKGKLTLDGKPVAKATVQFNSDKGDTVSGKTGDDGTYTATKVKPGSYKISIKGEDAAKLPEKFGDAKTSGLTVEVKEGSNTHDINLKGDAKPDPKDGEVSGVVTLDGQPLAKASVQFVPAQGAATKAETDDAGKYAVPALKAGAYKITVVLKKDDKTLTPETYGDAKTTPLTFDAKEGKNKYDVQLKSK